MTERPSTPEAPLTPEERTACLEVAQLSMGAFARLVGWSDSGGVRRWFRDPTTRVPPEADQLLRDLRAAVERFAQSAAAFRARRDSAR